MSKTLDELEQRRAAFKLLREQIDEDLRKQRLERLSAEQQAIDHLVFRAAAEGASLGAIKRAYGTKDHRTIADLVRNHSAEIESLKKAAVKAQTEMPDWLQLGAGLFRVHFSDEQWSDYTWAIMEDGKFLYSAVENLWNDDYTIKNEAVELLDGKTETDSDEARIVAKFLREQ